jgi:hypothetical protein
MKQIDVIAMHSIKITHSRKDGCEGCKYEFTYPNLDEEPCLSF